MNLILTLLAAFCVKPVVSQRQAQQCITPQNYYGQCVTLSYCPEVVNIFETTNQAYAQQYIFAVQRSCGTQNINGDPVVCCTRPNYNVKTTQRPKAQNTFLSTAQTPMQRTTSRNSRNPQTSNPFLATQAPSILRPTTRTIPAITSTKLPSQAKTKNSNCRGPDSRDGICIELKSCPELINELQSKQNDASFANFLRASNRICGSTGSTVCCPSQIIAEPTKLPYTAESPRRLPTLEEGCGFSKSYFRKIVGGQASKPGAWPWVALIGYEDELSGGTTFKCGGTLVTARHVVTAAHCIRKDLSLVRLGEHDLSTDTEAKHVDMAVVKVESHPDYNRRNGRNDIAILYLNSNTHFSDSITPICLPTTPDLRQKSYLKHLPFVVGWGKTMEGGTSATVLQELQIEVYANEVCEQSYRNQGRLVSHDQFDSAVICAGTLSGGQDTCQGDSGGPLIIPESNVKGTRYYLIGIVSYGIGCARPGIPGVYTSIQFFMDWITEQILNT